MTNKLLFGQRIADGWRALVEHLNNVSANTVEIAEEETSGNSQSHSEATSGPAGLRMREDVDG